MTTINEVLENVTIKGNILYLPDVTLDRKLYTEVAKQLNLIGGSWKSGKIKGFVFEHENINELIDKLLNPNEKIPNLKKEFQFFATPDSISDYLVELSDIKINDIILEPSTGQGSIINAIHRKFPEKNVDCCELMLINQIFLKKIPYVNFISEDFLTIQKGNFYDRIIANPPFKNNSDILHIKHMFNCLKIGGRLVSIASNHWKISSNKKETEFRDWLTEVNAEIINLPEGTFKESGTNIASCIIIINK